MNNIQIYTDGACSGNPGVGGWGVCILWGNKEHYSGEFCTEEFYGGEIHTTNNRMELTAALEGLRKMSSDTYKDIALKTVDVYTDSKYLQMGINNWIGNWVKKNWKTAGNKDVKNRDLWEELLSITKLYNINWHWVKAHNGNTYNERADFLANLGKQEIQTINQAN